MPDLFPDNNHLTRDLTQRTTYIYDLDDNEYFKSEVLDSLYDPMKNGHYFDYHATPVIGIASNNISENRSYLMGDPLLFCEEGIAFELKNSRVNVVPYSKVNKVSLIEKRLFI